MQPGKSSAWEAAAESFGAGFGPVPTVISPGCLSIAATSTH
jgi:hypothetical protein